MTNQEAVDRLKFVLNGAVKAGCFQDISTVVHVAQVLSYIEVMPQAIADMATEIAELRAKIKRLQGYVPLVQSDPAESKK